MTMYTPIFRPQYPDPTTTMDWSNCTMASGAMALDRHTLGRIQVWGGELRKHQDDQVGGTDLYDVRQAWAYYKQVLEVRSGQGWAGVLSALKDGRGVIIQYTRGYIGPEYRKGRDPGFGGGHAAYLNAVSDDGFLDYADPLNNGFEPLPASTMRAAAEALNKGVNFAVTRRTTEDEMYAVVNINPLAGGERRWRVAAGQTIRGYKVDAPNRIIKALTFSSASSAMGDAKVYVQWLGLATGQTAPVPRGGPFLRVTNGAFAGLLIPMHNITLDPDPDPQVDTKAAYDRGYSAGKTDGMAQGRSVGYTLGRQRALTAVTSIPTTPE